MKVGDLVKYNYGGPPGLNITHLKRREEDPWLIEHGEIGVVVTQNWKDKPDVAEIFFFGANYIKRSYKEYLEVVSESR